MRTLIIGLLVVGLAASIAPSAAAQPPCQPYCEDGVQTAAASSGTASEAGHGLPFLLVAGALAAGIALLVWPRRAS